MKRGVLLRSGQVDSLLSLGEGGRSVYRLADQLRDTLRRQVNPASAEHLAVPETNEQGTNLDWYSPIPGHVVAWTAATEEERAQATAQLERLQEEVRSVSLEGQSRGADSERVVFYKLFHHVLQFPDENYVYLVGGKPVVTFWGFVHHNAKPAPDPLLCLRPRIAAPPAAPASGAAVVPPPVPPVVTQVSSTSWWGRNWWRLLLAALALALLLFGLRWCSQPNLPAGLPSISLPSWTPSWFSKPWGNVSLPSVNTPQVSLPSLPEVNLTGGGLPSVALPNLGVDPQMPALNDLTAPELPAAPDLAIEPPVLEGQGENMPPMAAQPELSGESSGQTGLEPPLISAAPSAPTPPSVSTGPALQIPPAAMNTGAVDFLNGNWTANMGVQDSRTGKPVQLSYGFEEGQGSVTLKRGDGVECTAPVQAALNSGQLMIDNQAAAKCSDAGTYDMPQIRCEPTGQAGAARCAGVYGDKEFPLALHQTD